MKNWCNAAVLAVLTMLPTIQLSQVGSAKPINGQSQRAKKSADKKQASPEQTPAIATPTPTISPSPIREHPIEEKPTNNQQEYDAGSDKLYRAYLWATIIGVFGGLIGLVVLIHQAKAAK